MFGAGVKILLDTKCAASYTLSSSGDEQLDREDDLHLLDHVFPSRTAARQTPLCTRAHTRAFFARAGTEDSQGTVI